MLIKEDILSFLKKGSLLNIPFGIELEELVSRLGPANCSEKISNEDNRSEVLKYDRMEFHFSLGEPQLLRGVQVTHERACESFMLKVDHGGIDRSARYTEVKEVLETNNIVFRESYSSSNLNSQVLIAETGVSFFFSESGLIEKYGRFLQGL